MSATQSFWSVQQRDGEWGTEDLVAKAGIAQQAASLEALSAASVKSAD